MVIELGVLADANCFRHVGTLGYVVSSGSRKFPGSDSRKSAILSHGNKFRGLTVQEWADIHRDMKQVGFPVDQLPASPIARTPRPRHLGEWRPEGSPPPNGRNSGTGVKNQARASSRASSSQQHVGYPGLTPIFQGSQSQIHNNSSLSFNSFTQTPSRLLSTSVACALPPIEPLVAYVRLPTIPSLCGQA